MATPIIAVHRQEAPDYFAGGKCDFVNSRWIINGIDKAEKIAGHARVFLKALQS